MLWHFLQDEPSSQGLGVGIMGVPTELTLTVPNRNSTSAGAPCSSWLRSGASSWAAPTKCSGSTGEWHFQAGPRSSPVHSMLQAAWLAAGGPHGTAALAAPGNGPALLEVLQEAADRCPRAICMSSRHQR